MRMESLNR